MLSISSPTDNGNIRVINDDSPSDIHLEICKDVNNPAFFQWFHFTLQGEIGTHHTLNIDNAGAARYPGWNKHTAYQAYASYGNDEWFTIDTVYHEEHGKLTMELDLAQEQIHIAFFPPFTYARHLALIEKAKAIPHCAVSTLGKTNGADGRDITLLTFGNEDSNKKKIWVIARQHPGEPQAEWYAEGLIEHLEAHPELLDHYTFYLVPNMNPDGTYLGNLRTNKEGKDLNREWKNPSLKNSPEVYFVLEKMNRTGVDFFIDAHSDEVIPVPFLDEAHLSCPVINERLQDLERLFMNLYIEINESMQNELNYGEKDREDPEMLTLAAMSVGNQFHCPALTLEMPTKSWSWQQCKSLAKDFFEVLHQFYLHPMNQETQKLQAPRKHSFLQTQKTKEADLIDSQYTLN